ncbi:MAG TPA: serine/threonine-protein kinase, partial [Polyangia bacterium]
MSQTLPRRFGPYTLLRLLAHGQRGDLLLALRRDNVGQLCAVKLLPAAAFADPARREALRAEAPGLVRSFHGNVAQVVDVGELDGALYVVLEYVAGRPLAQVAADLARTGTRLPPELAAFAVMQACAGLGFLGGRGRPGWAASAMVSYEGELKLVDLGVTLAAMIRAEGPRAAMIAPEVLRAERYDARADVYAAGAMLWELVAGRLLCPGDAPAYLAEVAANHARPSLAEVAPGTPPALVSAAVRALSPFPDHRQRDPDTLFSEITEAISAALPEAPARFAAQLHGLYGAAAEAERVEVASLAERAGEALRQTGQEDQKAPRATSSFIAAHSERFMAAVSPTMPSVSGPLPTPPSPEGEDELPIGEIIPGTRYRVLSKVGQGGMGAVYLAEHVDIERKVALKLLSRDLAGDAESLARFRFEARTASRIGHPNIVEITDFGEAPGGRFFFVMEYLQGETLGAVLRRDERIAPARAVGILRQIAKALGAAHGKGIVHCDIKPDNIILLSLQSQAERRGHRRRADFVKVVDFGIAAMLEKRAGEPAAGASAFVAGTAEYMAPERARGADFDGRADVYSLGCMAYEMLTGDVPFHGPTLVATLTAHLKDAPQPLEQRSPEAKVPAGLSRWVLHAMAKDPASRPASCSELEAELCEAQVEAKLRTEWDHLELPDDIDAERRARLAARMPSAHKSRRGLVAAAVGFAVLSLLLGGYTVVQKPRFIFVNEEPPEVRALLARASEAAAAGQFTLPDGDSALSFLEKAAVLMPKSARVRQQREGVAKMLRGGADRLWDAGLRAAARDMYREALRFAPWDAALRSRAEVELAEAGAPASGPAEGGAGRGGTATPGQVRERDWLASQAELAIVEGRLTGARSAVYYLNELSRKDPEGEVAARVTRELGPELRARAQRFWEAGAAEEARGLYRLVLAMDPSDETARARAAAGSQPGPAPRPVPKPVAVAVAPAPQQDAGVPQVANA